ncbi:MAG: hypothetical protein EOO90_25685 [Pedobacter sp.]|nr:MAG: hypothetical protein EOO90_25685 [Pedobacter sp.]
MIEMIMLSLILNLDTSGTLAPEWERRAECLILTANADMLMDLVANNPYLVTQDKSSTDMFNVYDQCPCHSGKKAKFCCLVGKTWDKKPVLLTVEEPPSTYMHSKCYAKNSCDCVTKISGEHYISEYLLNNLGDEIAVNISGLPWFPLDEVKQVPKKALVANVLCERHNRLLSPYDNEMGRFHKILHNYDLGFQIDQPVEEFEIFCGEDLERWMLKTACTFIASKQIFVGEEQIDVELKESYVDILFRGCDFSEGCGLYTDARDGVIQYHNYIRFSFLIIGDALKSMKMVMNGLTLYLVIESPRTIQDGMVYRPRGVEFKKGYVKKTMEISWQNKKLNQGIFLTHQNLVTKTKQAWDDNIFSKDFNPK